MQNKIKRYYKYMYILVIVKNVFIFLLHFNQEIIKKTNLLIWGKIFSIENIKPILLKHQYLI